MDRYAKLGKNVALITLGNFASKLMSFFMIPLYTAVLSTAEYGVSDLITTTVNLLAPFCTLQISESVMRYTLGKKSLAPQALRIGLLVFFCGFLLMLPCSLFVLLNDALKPYYWYFIATYLFSTLHSILSMFVRGIERIAVFSISGVVQTFCFIAANLLFLLVFRTGVQGYLLSMILSNVAAIFVLWLGGGLSRYIFPQVKLNKGLMKDMLAYSIPMIPNSLSWWISNSSDKYLLTFFSGVAVTGIYSVAQRIPSLFSTISTIFMGAWQISAIEDFGGEESRKFFSNVYNQYSTLNILLVSGLICSCKFLARILFSANFFEGWRYVPILLFAFLFHSMAAFLGTVYTSAMKTKMLFISTIIAAVTNILFNIVLIPEWGAYGAAIATFVSYFLIWLIRRADSKKIIQLHIRSTADSLSYAILLLQIVLMLRDKPYSVPGAGGLFLVLCIIQYTTLKQLFHIYFNMTIRRLKG